MTTTTKNPKQNTYEIFNKVQTKVCDYICSLTVLSQQSKVNLSEPFLYEWVLSIFSLYYSKYYWLFYRNEEIFAKKIALINSVLFLFASSSENNANYLNVLFEINYAWSSCLEVKLLKCPCTWNLGRITLCG